MVQRVARTGESTSLRDSLWFILSTSAPVVLLTIFMVVHIQHWRATGHLNGLGLAAQEGVLIVLFLLRRRSRESLNTPSAWAAALIGSYGILLVRPGGYILGGSETPFIMIQAVGALLSVIAVIYLGRSFGIVAANRGVKTDGAYRIVRHPIYATYIVGLLGYLPASLSLWNILVIAVTWFFQIRRIYAEESVLMRDPEYRAYAQRVRYRLIPFVW